MRHGEELIPKRAVINCFAGKNFDAEVAAIKLSRNMLFEADTRQTRHISRTRCTFSTVTTGSIVTP